MTLWLLLIGFLTRDCRGAPQKTEVEMVESLRRQLMHENYDYMEGSDSDAITTTLAPPPDAEEELDEYSDTHAPVPAPAVPTVRPARPARGHSDQTEHTPTPTHTTIEPTPTLTKIEPQLNAIPESDPRSMLAPSHSRRALGADADADADAANEMIFNKKDLLDQRSEKNDLLYYLDDNRLDDPLLNEIDAVIADDAITTTTRRYKILKERAASSEIKSGRRNAGDGSRGHKRRIFLQEERDGHIAIVNLAGGPFPEFRLPKSRRQYMADDYEELKSIENEIFGSATEDTTTTPPPPPPTQQQQMGMRRAPLPFSEEEQTTTTKRRKKSHSEEYGLKMSSAYQKLVNEKKHMREDLYHPKRDRFELDHPDDAMREYYRTAPYDPLGEMQV